MAKMKADFEAGTVKNDSGGEEDSEEKVSIFCTKFSFLDLRCSV